MGKIASKIWSKGLLGGFGIPELSKPLEPLTFWSRADLIEAYQHFLDDCSQTLDRHEFTDVFQCFSDTISADAAFHALHPRKGKLDGNTIFGAVVATSNQTFISKVSLIYSIYDMDGDGALNKAEFTIVLRSLLHGLRLFYNDAVMPNDAELEVAIDECFKRWAELVELWETGRRVIWWARCGGLSGHLFT
ncbi:Potassium voltage-gated channel subfamily H member 7 [Durusdinium trenchii]|uniref:Potassium voltage-gated channel subfamily H member 7 n=1 Tax=Durusdinium trenchii TaxID=1381693 RepID=A0ABP0KND5_9DINO